MTRDNKPCLHVDILLPNLDATLALGEYLGERLKRAGGIVYLQGTLGVGKTSLSRGVMAAFGHSDPVKSPTYTLVEPYEFEQHTLYHFDLYRLGDPEELEYMGIREYFNDQSICLIEWPERGDCVLPKPDCIVEMSVAQLNQQHAASDVNRVIGRRASLYALTTKGEILIEKAQELFK